MRATATAAALFAAVLLTAGCSSSSDAVPDAKPAPATSSPVADETGPSKECTDAVFDMFLDEINGDGLAEHRPDACADLTEEQWSAVVDEQGDKILEVGESLKDDPEPLTEEEAIEQCTDAIAEAAPEWDDWTVDVDGWENDPETPEVCKSLETLDYMDAFTEGLDIAAACGTLDALPGRC